MWIGSARSNYFNVKDAKAFEAAMATFDVRIHPKGDGGGDARICLVATSDDGDWPSVDEDCEDIDFAGLVAGHLADGEVAVLQTIGADKLRYLTGHAVAVRADGERVSVSLGDIYDKAFEAFGVRPPEATY